MRDNRLRTVGAEVLDFAARGKKGRKGYSFKCSSSDWEEQDLPVPSRSLVRKARSIHKRREGRQALT